MKAPKVLGNLAHSEKFVVMGLLYSVPLFVLALLGKITVEYFREHAFWAMTILVGGKTVQGAAAALTESPPKKADLNVFSALLGSEKFWYVVVLFLVPLLVFLFMGKLSVVDWEKDSLLALSVFVGGKTVQGTAVTIARRRKKRET